MSRVCTILKKLQIRDNRTSQYKFHIHYSMSDVAAAAAVTIVQNRLSISHLNYTVYTFFAMALLHTLHYVCNKYLKYASMQSKKTSAIAILEAPMVNEQ